MIRIRIPNTAPVLIHPYLWLYTGRSITVRRFQQVILQEGGLEGLPLLLREDPPVEADQLDDRLLVGDHVQRVELDVDDLDLSLVLLQGRTVPAHQHDLKAERSMEQDYQ
jgi:hypothetical protein